MASMHTDRIIKTNGGTAIPQSVSNKYFQANNAVNIRRVSGSSDGAGNRFFDNIPNNTNLGSVKSQIASPSSYNPIATPFVQKGFSTTTGTSGVGDAVNGYGSVGAGFALTQFRKSAGSTSLVSAKPLTGIPGLAKFGGLKTYTLIKTYSIGETIKNATGAPKWVDLYGRVLEVNGSNIRLLNARDANAEITSNTVQATDGATNDDIAPGLRSYSNNKGLTYYTKLSASANPKIMIVAEASSSVKNING